MRGGWSTFCTIHFNWKSYYRCSLPKLEDEMNRGDDLKENGDLQKIWGGRCRGGIRQEQRWKGKKKDECQENQVDERTEEGGEDGLRSCHRC